MSWEALLNPDIRRFILENQDEDVHALALKKPPDKSWPYPLILDQIKARQKARVKLPRWLEWHPDIVFPAAATVEQASSAATARYKAALIPGKSFCDLTGGAGVDSCALSEHYVSGICIDCDAQTAAILAHNLPLLCNMPFRVQQTYAEEFLEELPDVDLILLDPQRRDSTQKGKFLLEECSPDVTALLPALQKKAKKIMLKTSPMLDISQTLDTLDVVQEVHAVEWRGECRETLYILDQSHKTPAAHIPVSAVHIDDEGEVISSLTFTKAQEERATPEYGAPGRYLYEPGPAFLKAGGFGTLAQKYGLKKLHKHTHLYTSNLFCSGFPGRAFEIIEKFPANPKALPFSRANLTVRNFPMKTEELKKKLKLKDGGEEYVFACTFSDGEKALLHTRKASA